jgi:hypothetical protein
VNGNVTVNRAHLSTQGTTVKGNVTVGPRAGLIAEKTTLKGNVTVGGELSGLTIRETTVKGNMTVGGEFSELNIGGSTVEGDVTVNPGGRLSSGEAVITGNVQGSGAEGIQLNGETSVGGSLRLTGTDGQGGNLNFVQEGKVDGNIEIEDGLVSTLVLDETVGGNLQVLDNPSGPLGFAGGQSLLRVEGSDVGGDVEVADNPLHSSVFNEIKVRDTAVANNLVVSGNSSMHGASGNFVIVEADRVGRDADVLNNKFLPGGEGKSASPVTLVSENLVTSVLNCSTNNPAPTDGEAPNTAKEKLGQCEQL